MKYQIRNGSFVDENQKEHKFIFLGNDINKNINFSYEYNSLFEYIDVHCEGKHDEITKYLYESFNNFIASNILKSNIDGERLLLDVGCGLYLNIPPYCSKLHPMVTYVGLDPINLYIDRRNYLFICGKFEDLSNYITNKFDYIVFATSLDHLMSIDKTIDTIKKIITRNGIIFFWVGLHDAYLVAHHYLTKKFNFEKLDYKRVIYELLKKSLKIPLSAIRLSLLLLYRESHLKRKIPLDNLHYHYFLSDSLRKIMEKIGNIYDFIHIYGTNSVFYAIKPKQ